MTDPGAEQRLLSAFDAGDPSIVDLSIDDSTGYDLAGRRRIREYAEAVAAGGWVLAEGGDVTSVIWWQHPDPTVVRMYKIEKKSAGWHGYHRDRQVKPAYTEDLQAALDAAGEWMAAHPLRDVVGDGGAER